MLPTPSITHACLSCRTAARSTANLYLLGIGSSTRPFNSSSLVASHENPLGLPRNNDRRPPQMPRRSRGGVPEKRSIPYVKKVLAVSSGKGGVGKSTISANLALALAQTASVSCPSSISPPPRKPRIGLLDLDIFGPSVPKLMGLEDVGEPELTQDGALIPLTNHGIPCMSMGFLLPPASSGSNADIPIVWRGMMVMKATQQLLFDVDWRRGASPSSSSSAGTTTEQDDWLDVLVIDMPPGTGDVALSLGQLVKVDGAVIVSTPQQVALVDARKGVSMFDKVNVPITGMVLNMSHFVSPDTGRTFHLFGPSQPFESYAEQRNVPILGRIPLQPDVSVGGDKGLPTVLRPTIHVDILDPNNTAASSTTSQETDNLARNEFLQIATQCWRSLV
ncbi:hypothetical protein ACQY0O_002547 [Thecaphora frezii]|nr:putative p-loop containing nucleoside triphosphate hydrolase protein [Thecaphora frezii]